MRKATRAAQLRNQLDGLDHVIEMLEAERSRLYRMYSDAAVSEHYYHQGGKGEHCGLSVDQIQTRLAGEKTRVFGQGDPA